MTSVPKPSSLANSLTLKWDAWNRLVEAKDGQTVIGVYEYDGLSRRVKRHVDSQAPGSPNGLDTYVHYFYNQYWQVLEIRDTTTESDEPESLQPDWQYVSSPRYTDAAVLRDKNTDTDGLCDDERLYFLSDANFNVTTLVDTAGDALERYLYDPYGNATIYDGSWGSTRSASSYGNVVRYTGREWDGETGIYHYRHRYYGAELGRFVSRDAIANDPISYWARMTLYEYSGDSPVNGTDPEGRKVCKLMIFVGHDYEAEPWINANKDQFGDGTYAGVVSCGSRGLNDRLGKNKIPGIGGNLGILWKNKLYDATERAIKKAKDQADSMCSQHKRGDGKDSACDSVQTTVQCSAAAKDVMDQTRGKAPDLCSTPIPPKPCPPPESCP